MKTNSKVSYNIKDDITGKIRENPYINADSLNRLLHFYSLIFPDFMSQYKALELCNEK